MSSNLFYKKGYTHGGPWHMDEMGCIALLRMINPSFTYERQKSREDDIPEEYLNDSEAIVFDVGNGKFDHHDNNTKYHKNGTKYAACGKVFDEIKDTLKIKKNLSDNELSKIERVVEAIDAADNGEMHCFYGYNDLAALLKDTYSEEHPARFDMGCRIVQDLFEGMIQASRRRPGSRHASYNNTMKAFNEMQARTPSGFSKEQKQVFKENVNYGSYCFLYKNRKYQEKDLVFQLINNQKYTKDTIAIVKYLFDCAIVEKAKKSALNYQMMHRLKNKSIIKGAAILKTHINTTEPHIREILNQKKILFIVYPNQDGGYNMQTVNRQRLQFPKKWGGVNKYTKKRPEGMPEPLSFVHNDCFIGSFSVAEQNDLKRVVDCIMSAIVEEYWDDVWNDFLKNNRNNLYKLFENAIKQANETNPGKENIPIKNMINLTKKRVKKYFFGNQSNYQYDYGGYDEPAVREGIDWAFGPDETNKRIADGINDIVNSYLSDKIKNKTKSSIECG